VSKVTYLGIVFTTDGYFNTFFEMLAGQELKAIYLNLSQTYLISRNNNTA